MTVLFLSERNVENNEDNVADPRKLSAPDDAYVILANASGKVTPIASFDAIQWNSLMGAPSDARATPLLLPPKTVSHTKVVDPCIFVDLYLIKVAL